MTSANPFWDYSLNLYARPDVQDSCLCLQDDHQQDVNMLLYACWQGSRGLELSPQEFSAIQQGLAEWREQLLLPARSLRRSLAKALPADHRMVNGARRLELVLERWQQLQLYSWRVDHSTRGTPASTIQANLLSLWRAAGESEPPKELSALSLSAQELLS